MVARLSAPDGPFVEIEILGYEFPDITEDPWDSNWLVVRIHARNGAREWTAAEPAIDTMELGSLIAGLRSLAAGEVEQIDWEPLEPEIAIHGRRQEGGVKLDVVLDYGFRSGDPPQSENLDEDKVVISLQLMPLDVQRFAGELDAYQSQFPMRGGGRRPVGGSLPREL